MPTLHRECALSNTSDRYNLEVIKDYCEMDEKVY